MKRFFLITFLSFLFSGVFTQTTQETLKQVRSTGVLEMVDGKEFYIHTIKKGQTLYMISKAYGVDVNDIITENPEVKNGIRADQKIRIPIKPKEEQVKKRPKPPVKEPPAVKTDTVKQEVTVADIPCGKDTAAMRLFYNVALMLPLSLDETPEIDLENLPADPYTAYNPLKFIQFYEGFMMAVDSLKQTGLPMNIYVYDVGKDTSKTRRLLRDTTLRSMNLIVGLLYHRSFQMVASFAAKYHIPIINPVSERTDILTGNPMVIKVRPPAKSQVTELADFMKASFYRGHILIIRNGQFRDRDMPELLLKACKERQLEASLVEGQDAAIGKLSKEKENYLVAFTDNGVYALDLSRRLYGLRNDYSITLVGLPKWEKVEGLETEYLVKLNTHIMAPWFIDYTDPDVKRFTSAFQEKYRTDPGILAFQGFDIANFFLTALKNFGTTFSRCMQEVKIKTIHTAFELLPTNGNGYENQHWDVLRYDNYQLKRGM